MENNVKEEIREILEELGEEFILTDEQLDSYLEEMINDYFDMLKLELFNIKITLLIDMAYLKLSNIIMNILNFTVKPFEFARFDCEINSEIIKSITFAHNEVKRVLVLLKRLKKVQKLYKNDLMSLSVIEEILISINQKEKNLIAYTLCKVDFFNRQREEFTYIPGKVVENEGPKHDERIEMLLLELKKS